MKILIATGIFEPESGGPATLSAGLARKLTEAGHQVTVLTYANQVLDTAQYPFKLVSVVRKGKLSNRIRLFRAARSLVRDVDVIYTFDWFAVGFPLALAARMAHKPYIVRVGGDYLWEQKYLESGAPPMTLKEFYEKRLHRRLSYRPVFFAISWVLRGAQHVVFNSDQLRELCDNAYGLSRSSVIWTPMPENLTKVAGSVRLEFIFWGRMIVMKNLDTLLRAFAIARIPHSYTLTLIGDGPQKEALMNWVLKLGLQGRVHFEPAMPRDKVLARVAEARLFILPSWTDISPNQACEALAIGLPSLITKESYLPFRDQLPETIDPSSVEDMAHKLEKMVDNAHYLDFVNRWNAISFSYTWEAFVQKHLELFNAHV